MTNSFYHHPQEDQFRKWSVPLPEVHTHGTEADIESNLERLLPNEWHMEGNELKGTTKEGHVLVQRIPTDYICIGTDENGLPLLRKIIL